MLYSCPARHLESNRGFISAKKWEKGNCNELQFVTETFSVRLMLSYYCRSLCPIIYCHILQHVSQQEGAWGHTGAWFGLVHMRVHCFLGIIMVTALPTVILLHQHHLALHQPRKLVRSCHSCYNNPPVLVARGRFDCV